MNWAGFSNGWIDCFKEAKGTTLRKMNKEICIHCEPPSNIDQMVERISVEVYGLNLNSKYRSLL